MIFGKLCPRRKYYTPECPGRTCFKLHSLINFVSHAQTYGVTLKEGIMIGRSAEFIVKGVYLPCTGNSFCGLDLFPYKGQTQAAGCVSSSRTQ